MDKDILPGACKTLTRARPLVLLTKVPLEGLDELTAHFGGLNYQLMTSNEDNLQRTVSFPYLPSERHKGLTPHIETWQPWPTTEAPESGVRSCLI